MELTDVYKHDADAVHGSSPANDEDRTPATARPAHRRRSYSVGHGLDALLHSHSNRTVAFSSLRAHPPPAPPTSARSHVIHTSVSRLQHLPALAMGLGPAAAQQPWSDGLMGDATLVDDAPPPSPGVSTIVVMPGHHLHAADVVHLLGPHAAHFERRHSTRSVRSVGSRPPLEFHVTIFVAVLLALNAGLINGCTLLSFQVTVAHVTGAVTRTGTALAEQDGPVVALYGACVLAFLAGSVCVGYWLPHRAFQRGVAHGALFLVAAALLATACLFAFYSPGVAHAHREYFLSLAAAACGMQNALSSRYSANIFRTTHLTGTLTDLGVLLGRLLAGDCREELWKAYVMVSLVLGFFLGGVLSVSLVRRFGDLALLWSAGAMALFGALVAYVAATRCEAQWWAALEALGALCLQRGAAAADAVARTVAVLQRVGGVDGDRRKRTPGAV
eukprot:gene5171-3690_t